MKTIILLWLALLPLGSLDAQEKATASMDDPEGQSLLFFEKAGALFLESPDSAIFYLQAGIPYYEVRKSWVNYVNCFNGLASCYYQKGDYPASIRHIEKASQEAERLIGKKNVAYTSAINNLGQILSEKGAFDQALQYFQESLALEEEMGNKKEAVSVLSNIGVALMDKGDYEEAEVYYKKALDYQLEISRETAPQTAVLYNVLARAFKLRGEENTALELFRRSFGIFNHPTNPDGPIITRKKAEVLYSMADIYSQRQEVDSLNFCIQRARSLERKIGHRSSRGEVLLGNWFLKRSNHNRAESHFQEALQIKQSFFASFDAHPEIGNIYRHLGQTYASQDKLSEGLKNYHYALLNYSIGTSSNNSFSNPPLDSLIADKDILPILRGKANTLFAFYQKEKDPQYLEAADQTYTLAVAMIRKLRKEFLAEASKEYFSSFVLPIYEDALACALEKHQQDPTDEHLNKAFQLAEASKAGILFESINENTAKGFAGIPDSLLGLDQSLQKEIAFYQRKIYEEKQNRDKIKLWEATLFDLRREHQELIAFFETAYPDFHRMKYNTKLAAIPEIQSGIPDGQTALIEYFAGEEHIYLFVITQQGAKVMVSQRPEDLNTLVENLRNFLHRPPDHQSAQKDYLLFANTSHQLYQQLVQPASLSAEINRLIIIPDDVLGYLPFEILLRNEPDLATPSYSHRQLDYLVEDFRISYNYSAGLWLQNQDRTNHKGKGFIGFAPDFEEPASGQVVTRDCSADQLYQLRCSAAEVESISSLLRGQSLTGDHASKEQFMEKAGQFNILHFATHSCLNDDNPMLNKIFLANDYISNYDLYNIRLNADLAVLSACNTGSGPLLRGEGVMSLFRGFLYAGCPSSLISFWSVEDCTTQGIMETYYQNLKDGKNKDEAIQLAKLSYLEQADRLHAHPFYWAPFVQFGATRALDFQSRVSTLYGVAVAVFLLSLVYFFRRQKIL